MPNPVRNTFDGGTNGTTITVGNSGGSSGDALASISIGTGNTAVFSNDRPRGSTGLGMKIGQGATAGTGLNWAFASNGRHVFRLESWAYDAPGTFPASNLGVMSVYEGANLLGTLYVDTAGKLRLHNAANTLISSSASAATLAKLTEYDIEFSRTLGPGGTDGVLEYRYYLAGSSTPIETMVNSAQSVGTLETTTLRASPRASVTGGGVTVWYDNLQGRDLASGWIGMGVVAAVLATASGLALAPTIAAAANVQPPVATATGTASVPTVIAASTVTTPAGTATGTMLVPTVVAGSAAAVAVPAAAATGAALAPTVSAGATVAAQTGVGTAQVFPPAVSAPANVAVPTVSGSAIANLPAVSAAATVIAPLLTANGVAYAPTVSVPMTISVPVATAAAYMTAPVVGLPRDISITTASVRERWQLTGAAERMSMTALPERWSFTPEEG